MSYESEERLMVQGIENDARRWPEHGEIPPTHDELVKIAKDKERQKNGEWVCPKCGGKIKASGFTGNLFCWGKCYHYLSKNEVAELIKPRGE